MPRHIRQPSGLLKYCTQLLKMFTGWYKNWQAASTFVMQAIKAPEVSWKTHTRPCRDLASFIRYTSAILLKTLLWDTSPRKYVHSEKFTNLSGHSGRWNVRTFCTSSIFVVCPHTCPFTEVPREIGDVKHTMDGDRISLPNK